MIIAILQKLRKESPFSLVYSAGGQDVRRYSKARRNWIELKMNVWTDRRENHLKPDNSSEFCDNSHIVRFSAAGDLGGTESTTG